MFLMYHARILLSTCTVYGLGFVTEALNQAHTHVLDVPCPHPAVHLHCVYTV